MFLMPIARRIILENHSEEMELEGISALLLLIKMRCFNLQSRIDKSQTGGGRLQTSTLRQYTNDLQYLYTLSLIIV
jgi:hypothetical protein